MHTPSYTTSGDGVHTLFLHGFMGGSPDWDGVIGGLGDGFLSIAPDLPGHGNSVGLPDEAYSMEGAANAALRMLDGLGVERTSVVGYSMGGRLALFLALRHPERCESIVLESASPGMKTESERAARRAADEEKATRLETGDFHAFLEEWHRMPLFSTLDAATVERLIESRMGNDPRELARSLRGMGTGSQPGLWDELESLRVPTLAIAGEMDGKFVGIAREMAARSPNVSVEVVPGVGHNVHIESPGEYLSLSRGFISRAGGG